MKKKKHDNQKLEKILILEYEMGNEIFWFNCISNLAKFSKNERESYMQITVISHSIFKVSYSTTHASGANISVII